MRYLSNRKMDDLGAIGIGAMIVLIAMILVAGVAASVLISTSNTLQSQAMKTGQQTTREVASGIKVFSVIGQVNRTGSSGSFTYNDIWKLAITVSPKPGSEKIDLNNTYILISDGTTKALLTYGYNNSSTYNDDVTGDIFGAITDWSGLTNATFGIGVLQDYDGSLSRYNPVMTQGDKVILYLYTNSSYVFDSQIGERKDIFGRVIPEVGAPGVISFTSPQTYVDVIYALQ
jgi:archaeal flagellin FlaB